MEINPGFTFAKCLNSVTSNDSGACAQIIRPFLNSTESPFQSHSVSRVPVRSSVTMLMGCECSSWLICHKTSYFIPSNFYMIPTQILILRMAFFFWSQERNSEQTMPDYFPGFPSPNLPTFLLKLTSGQAVF